MSDVRYSDPQFCSDVMAMYVHDGPAATARYFDMPRSTVNSWAKRDGLYTDAATKKGTEAACLAKKTAREWLEVELWEKAKVMVSLIGNGMPSSDCKNIATTAAILVDKGLLLAGEATSREEVRHDYADKTDSDLIREAESILQEATDR